MISVCIATYNGGDMLKTQLESIVNQLSTDDEVILSEDGDIEATKELAANIPYPNIKIIEGAKVKSPIYNFEKCISHAHGDYIFLADQDDKWLPNKVEVMMQALHEYDCVCSDCIVTDGDYNIINDSFFSMIGMKQGKYFNLLKRNCYLGCCMAFKRKILEKALPFPKKLPMHDIWIGNIAAFFYSITFINDKLILFRRHGNNASCTASVSPYSLTQKINFRYQIIKGLLFATLR